MKPEGEVLEVNFEELEALLERARQGPLGENDYQKLHDALHALSHLIELIVEKETTISRLRALLMKPSTEKTRKVLEQAGIQAPPKNSSPLNAKDPPKPGHGRHGAEAFEAEAPEGVGEKKYDEPTAAMTGLLRYGSGVPFYRLAGLEENLGVPLPPSTPWEIVAETAQRIRPAFEALIRQAAQGEALHNDDTAMKILARARASPCPAEPHEAPAGSRERTGQFTSGIVSTREGQRIALFFTGRRHAGENLTQVLAERAKGSIHPFKCAMPYRATSQGCRRSSKSSWGIVWRTADAVSMSTVSLDADRRRLPLRHRA